MNYRITNRASKNTQVLNQKQYDRFFDNNSTVDYTVEDNDIINSNKLREAVGYILIVSAIIMTIYTNL